MSTSATERSRISKKPGIPRPSGVRHSLGQLSVSKVIGDVLGNKENAKDSRRIPTVAASSTKLVTIKDVKEPPTVESSKRKSPTEVKATQPTTKTDASTPSPTSARKPSSLTAQNPPTMTVLKPRDSLATSLPKYKPKVSIVPPKQITLSRKRRNSLVEAVDEESSGQESSKRRVERPISPLPRRSRVQSNVSTSSRIFDPKIILTTPQKSPGGLRTPVKTKGTMSTPGSLRIRTLSTASSRLSVKLDSPTTRTEKRPRLSSDPRANNSLLASTSTIGADMSSDSIDIADVSALLAVSPNVSPAKSIGPASVRRVTVRRPLPSSGPTTPSRRSGNSAIPPRQNPSYLSPPPAKGTAPLRRPPPRGTGATDRGSVLSWADFSNKKYHEEDLNLIAEIVPLKGVITPGSDDFHPRERVDSGWGIEAPNIFSGVSSGPSIGQLMFPTAQPPKQDQAPNSDAVSAKLLHVKLSSTERELAELQAKVRAYEAHILATGGNIMISDVDTANELSVRTLQNAELEAKAAFLEESLNTVRQVVSEKDAELEQSMLEASRLEEQCEIERKAKDESLQMAQKMAQDSVLEIKRQVSAALAGKVADATKAETRRWRRKFDYLSGIEDAGQGWGVVQSSALADLDTVRQMQATLRVLMAGVEAVKLNTTDIS